MKKSKTSRPRPPSGPAAAMRQIQELIQAQRLSEARARCRELCLAAEDDAEAWFLLATIHLRLGETLEAEACCRRALTIRVDLPGVHYQLGAILAQRDEYEQAEQCYRRAVDLKPDFALAHLSLGLLLYSRGKLDEAVDCVRRSLRIVPGNADAHIALGDMLREQGERIGAEASFREALRYAPASVAAYLRLGNLLHELKRYDDALQCYRKILELQPSYAEVYHNMGNTFLFRGSVDEAIGCYEQALRLKPEFAAAYTNLGGIFAARGDLDAATAIYDRGVRTLPANAGLRCELAKTLSELGRRSEAAEHLRHAKEADPENVEADYLLAALPEEALPPAAKLPHVARMFDEHAERFDAELVGSLGYRVPEHMNRLLRQCLGARREALDILDLGCGTGLCGPLVRDIAATLVGVDVAPKMIEMSRRRGVYDALHMDDIVAVLRRERAAFDVVLAGDVFIYVGDLEEVFPACAGALRCGGLFVFSTETVAGCDYVMRSSGRYGHPVEYIQRMAAENGFVEAEREVVVIRTECFNPVDGHVYVLRKP